MASTVAVEPSEVGDPPNRRLFASAHHAHDRLGVGVLWGGCGAGAAQPLNATTAHDPTPAHTSVLPRVMVSRILVPPILPVRLTLHKRGERAENDEVGQS